MFKFESMLLLLLTENTSIFYHQTSLVYLQDIKKF